MKRYTAAELRAMPTLCVGQADSLKIDTGTERVWLSRCGIEDGEPCNNKITVEIPICGSWVTVEDYEG